MTPPLSPQDPGTSRRETSALPWRTLLCCLVLVLAACLLPAQLAAGVREGLSLSMQVVLPALFPFFILTDWFLAQVDLSHITRADAPLRRLLALPGASLSALLCGLLCGYPIGAIATAELYRRRQLSREEAERLIAIANNSSAAFLIGGVGIGLRHSLRAGLLLYLISVLSALLTGCLFAIGRRCPADRPQLTVAAPSVRFSFPGSVRRAGDRAVTVTAFLLTFSALSSLLRGVLGRSLPLYLLLPLLEVGCATRALAEAPLPDLFSFALTGLAVGCSGLSVYAQTAEIASEAGLSPHRYPRIKLVQGLLALLLALLLYPLLIHG